MKILLLVNDFNMFSYGNHLLFHNAMIQKGYDVWFGDLHTLEIIDSVIMLDAVQYLNKIEANTLYDKTISHVEIETFDVAWLFDHPAPSAELDLFQILWVAAKHVKFVNDISNSFFLNNKIVLRSLLGENAVIGTVVSNRYERLEELLDPKENWVVKPPSEGNGQDVYLIQPDDKNRSVILESMTGNGRVKRGTYDPSMVGFCSKYLVAQPFIEAAGNDEKRFLYAGGKLIGWYGTRKKNNDHRANRIHGTQKFLLELSDTEKKRAKKIGKILHEYGINYCAVDFAGESVLELNILTPGGIQILSQLINEDQVQIALERILVGINYD